MTGRHRKKRLRDYCRRLGAGKPEVGVHGDFLRIHDYLQAEVDAYWRFRRDVVFLQVMGQNGRRDPGLYYRWDDRSPTMMCLVAVLHESVVSQQGFEEAMVRFVRAGVFRRRPRRSTTRLVKVGAC